MNDERREILVKVKAKFTPVKCPNCSGYGSFSYGKVQCPSCEGKGILMIPAEEVKE